MYPWILGLEGLEMSFLDNSVQLDKLHLQCSWGFPQHRVLKSPSAAVVSKNASMELGLELPHLREMMIKMLTFYVMCYDGGYKNGLNP